MAQPETIDKAFEYAHENVEFVRDRIRENEEYSLAVDIRERFGLTTWTAEKIATIVTLKSDGWWYMNPSLYDF